jgi:hypothetical protein
MKFNFTPRSYFVQERTLSKCHILRNSTKNLEKVGMKRAKSFLRPIVQDSDHPSLPFLIRNPDEFPKGTSLFPRKEGVILLRKILENSQEEFSRLTKFPTPNSFDRFPNRRLSHRLKIDQSSGESRTVRTCFLGKVTFRPGSQFSRYSLETAHYLPKGGNVLFPRSLSRPFKRRNYTGKVYLHR